MRGEAASTLGRAAPGVKVTIPSDRHHDGHAPAQLDHAGRRSPQAGPRIPGQLRPVRDHHPQGLRADTEGADGVVRGDHINPERWHGVRPVAGLAGQKGEHDVGRGTGARRGLSPARAARGGGWTGRLAADRVGDAVGEAGAPDASPLDVADGAGDITPGLAVGDAAAPLPNAAAAALPAWPVPVVWDAGCPPTRPEQAQISSPTTPRLPTSAKNRRRQYAFAWADRCLFVTLRIRIHTF